MGGVGSGELTERDETFRCGVCGREASVEEGGADRFPEACASCWNALSACAEEAERIQHLDLDSGAMPENAAPITDDYRQGWADAAAVIVGRINGIPWPEPEPRVNPGSLGKPPSVAFLCGPAPRPWNPDIVARGFGGSETAVVEVAKRLARLGCQVTVYGSPGEDGTWDGVDYIGWTPEVRPKADVAVVWRLAALLPQVDAKVRLMWCHDVTAVGMTYELSLLADRFLALSEWHRGNLVKEHGIPESQVYTTRNGV